MTFRRRSQQGDIQKKVRKREYSEAGQEKGTFRRRSEEGDIKKNVRRRGH